MPTAAGQEWALSRTAFAMTAYIPPCFPPPSTVRFKVCAHVFCDLLKLASNMACHLREWVLLQSYLSSGKGTMTKEV